MLVDEDGARFAALFEDLDDLFEELVARVELLVLFVVRIVAVFADEDDAVDGEFARAERQRVGDGFRDREVVGGGEALADVAGVDLIHPERGDGEGRRRSVSRESNSLRETG